MSFLLSNFAKFISTVFQVYNSGSKNYDEKVMARYGISADLSGTVSPAMLDVEFFNYGITYQPPSFIINDPGYYRFTIQCYHMQNGPDFSKYAELIVVVDFINVITTTCKWADNKIVCSH